MALFRVGNTEARRLLLTTQWLSRPRNRRLSDDDLLGLVDQLGYVQVDSINTVERAHHLILFSRNQTYRQDQLVRLLEKHSTLFENWTHDASIIPSKFFPYWIHRFGHERDALRERWRKWGREGFEEQSDALLEHIREGGPVMARDFAQGRQGGTDGWWNWHPSKTALEYLWRTGELAVARREGFQKVYDLTERVIPPCFRESLLSGEEHIEWSCATALDRLGFATAGEIAAFWGGITPAEARAWCQRHLSKDIIEVLIESADSSKTRRAYARPDLPDRISRLPQPSGQIRVLSPFDPLIRDRSRTERLFDFRYRIEVFVPEAKREYGYYVFPILERDHLVGRIDMKFLRERGVLHVSGLWFEHRFQLNGTRRAKLYAELARLCKFIGANRVTFENHLPRLAD